MSHSTPLGTKIAQTQWPQPVRAAMSGVWVDLVPLDDSHLDALWAQACAHPDSFTYLRYGPFVDKNALATLIGDLSNRPEQPFWAVVPKGQPPCGWASICDVYDTDGSIEIGSIWFAPPLQGTRAGREALFLLMGHCMDALGYARLVWRCHAQNAASCKAAENLGFTHEGTWRHAAVVKGWQRDIAWFSMLQDEWPAHRAALAGWLHSDNFDAAGQMRQPLGTIRAQLGNLGDERA